MIRELLHQYVPVTVENFHEVLQYLEVETGSQDFAVSFPLHTCKILQLIMYAKW
jgi:hypothetical protein